MLSTLDILILLSPVLLVFGVLFNSDKIVAWWEKKHPELRSPSLKASVLILPRRFEHREVRHIPPFPWAGLIAWGVAYSLPMMLCVWSLLSGGINTGGFVGLTIFFTIVMLAGGLTAFFGSDYAQAKWNPEGK